MGRILPLFLSLCLGLPAPALALREPEAAESHSLAGLEEALASGEPRQVAQVVNSGLQRIFLPAPGRPEADPFSAVGLEEDTESIDQLIGGLFGPEGRLILQMGGVDKWVDERILDRGPYRLWLKWSVRIIQRTAVAIVTLTVKPIAEGKMPIGAIVHMKQYAFRLVHLQDGQVVSEAEFVPLVDTGNEVLGTFQPGAYQVKGKFTHEAPLAHGPPVFALEVSPPSPVTPASVVSLGASAPAGRAVPAASPQFPPERDLSGAQTYAELTADPSPSQLHQVEFVGPGGDDAVRAGTTEFIELPEGGVGIPWETFARWRMQMHILQPTSPDGVGGFNAFLMPEWGEPAGLVLNVISDSPAGNQPMSFELTQTAERFISSSGFMHVEAVPGRAVYIFPVEGPLWIERLPTEVLALAQLLLARLDLPHTSLREHAVHALSRLDYAEHADLREEIWQVFFRQLIPPPEMEEPAVDPEENHRVRAALILGLDWLSVTPERIRTTQEVLRQLVDSGNESGHADAMIERALGRLERRAAMLDSGSDSELLPPTEDVRLQATDPIEVIGEALAQSLWPMDYRRRIHAAEALARHPNATQAVSLLLGRLDLASGEQQAEIRQTIVRTLSGRRYSDPGLARQVREVFMDLLLPGAGGVQAQETNQQTRLLLLRNLEPLSLAGGNEGVQETLSFLERLQRGADAETSEVNNHRRALQRLLAVNAAEFDPAEVARQFQSFLDEMRQTLNVFHGTGPAAEQANANWSDLTATANLLSAWVEATQTAFILPLPYLAQLITVLPNAQHTLGILEEQLATAINGSLTAQALHIHFELSTAHAGAYLNWLDRLRWELALWQERFDYMAGQEERNLLSSKWERLQDFLGHYRTPRGDEGWVGNAHFEDSLQHIEALAEDHQYLFEGTAAAYVDFMRQRDAVTHALQMSPTPPAAVLLEHARAAVSRITGFPEENIIYLHVEDEAGWFATGGEQFIAIEEDAESGDWRLAIRPKAGAHYVVSDPSGDTIRFFVANVNPQIPLSHVVCALAHEETHGVHQEDEGGQWEQLQFPQLVRIVREGSRRLRELTTLQGLLQNPSPMTDEELFLMIQGSLLPMVSASSKLGWDVEATAQLIQHFGSEMNTADPIPDTVRALLTRLEIVAVLFPTSYEHETSFVEFLRQHDDIGAEVIEAVDLGSNLLALEEALPLARSNALGRFMDHWWDLFEETIAVNSNSALNSLRFQIAEEIILGDQPYEASYTPRLLRAANLLDGRIQPAELAFAFNDLATPIVALVADYVRTGMSDDAFGEHLREILPSSGLEERSPGDGQGAVVDAERIETVTSFLQGRCRLSADVTGIVRAFLEQGENWTFPVAARRLREQSQEQIYSDEYALFLLLQAWLAAGQGLDFEQSYYAAVVGQTGAFQGHDVERFQDAFPGRVPGDLRALLSEAVRLGRLAYGERRAISAFPFVLDQASLLARLNQWERLRPFITNLVDPLWSLGAFTMMAAADPNDPWHLDAERLSRYAWLVVERVWVERDLQHAVMRPDGMPYALPQGIENHIGTVARTIPGPVRRDLLILAESTGGVVEASRLAARENIAAVGAHSIAEVLLRSGDETNDAGSGDFCRDMAGHFQGLARAFVASMLDRQGPHTIWARDLLAPYLPPAGQEEGEWDVVADNLDAHQVAETLKAEWLANGGTKPLVVPFAETDRTEGLEPLLGLIDGADEMTSRLHVTDERTAQIADMEVAFPCAEGDWSMTNEEGGSADRRVVEMLWLAQNETELPSRENPSRLTSLLLSEFSPEQRFGIQRRPNSTYYWIVPMIAPRILAALDQQMFLPKLRGAAQDSVLAPVADRWRESRPFTYKLNADFPPHTDWRRAQVTLSVRPAAGEGKRFGEVMRVKLEVMLRSPYHGPEENTGQALEETFPVHTSHLALKTWLERNLPRGKFERFAPYLTVPIPGETIQLPPEAEDGLSEARIVSLPGTTGVLAFLGRILPYATRASVVLEREEHLDAIAALAYQSWRYPIGDGILSWIIDKDVVDLAQEEDTPEYRIREAVTRIMPVAFQHEEGYRAYSGPPVTVLTTEQHPQDTILAALQEWYSHLDRTHFQFIAIESQASLRPVVQSLIGLLEINEYVAADQLDQLAELAETGQSRVSDITSSGQEEGNSWVELQDFFRRCRKPWGDTTWVKGDRFKQSLQHLTRLARQHKGVFNGGVGACLEFLRRRDPVTHAFQGTPTSFKTAILGHARVAISRITGFPSDDIIYLPAEDEAGWLVVQGHEAIAWRRDEVTGDCWLAVSPQSGSYNVISDQTGARARFIVVQADPSIPLAYNVHTLAHEVAHSKRPKNQAIQRKPAQFQLLLRMIREGFQHAQELEILQNFLQDPSPVTDAELFFVLRGHLARLSQESRRIELDSETVAALMEHFGGSMNLEEPIPDAIRAQLNRLDVVDGFFPPTSEHETTFVEFLRRQTDIGESVVEAVAVDSDLMVLEQALGPIRFNALGQFIDRWEALLLDIARADRAISGLQFQIAQAVILGDEPYVASHTPRLLRTVDLLDRRVQPVETLLPMLPSTVAGIVELVADYVRTDMSDETFGEHLTAILPNMAGQEEGTPRRQAAKRAIALAAGATAFSIAANLAENAPEPPPQYIPTDLPGLQWSLVRRGVAVDPAETVSQAITIAAQPNLLKTLRANFPNNPIVPLPDEPESIAGALAEIRPRLVFLDRGSMNPEQARQVLPEQRPPTFLVWQAEAEEFTPPVAAAILRLQRRWNLPTENLFLFRLRRDQVGNTILDLYA